jgi:hypothetical protein
MAALSLPSTKIVYMTATPVLPLQGCTGMI